MTSSPHCRRRIYLGCSGEKEYEYTRWLQLQLDKNRLPYCLHRKTLGGGPLHRMLEIATHDRARQTRIAAFNSSFLLLDSDQLGGMKEDLESGIQAATSEAFDIIWETPCAEAFLLRHQATFRNMNFALPEEARAAFKELFGTTDVPGLYRLETVLQTQLAELWQLCPTSNGLERLLIRLEIPRLI